MAAPRENIEFDFNPTEGEIKEFIQLITRTRNPVIGNKDDYFLIKRRKQNGEADIIGGMSFRKHFVKVGKRKIQIADMLDANVTPKERRKGLFSTLLNAVLDSDNVSGISLLTTAVVTESEHFIEAPIVGKIRAAGFTQAEGFRVPFLMHITDKGNSRLIGRGDRELIGHPKGRYLYREGAGKIGYFWKALTPIGQRAMEKLIFQDAESARVNGKDVGTEDYLDQLLAYATDEEVNVAKLEEHADKREKLRAQIFEPPALPKFHHISFQTMSAVATRLMKEYGSWNAIQKADPEELVKHIQNNYKKFIKSNVVDEETIRVMKEYRAKLKKLMTAKKEGKWKNTYKAMGESLGGDFIMLTDGPNPVEYVASRKGHFKSFGIEQRPVKPR